MRLTNGLIGLTALVKRLDRLLLKVESCGSRYVKKRL
jgi:hypothetical protein